MFQSVVDLPRPIRIPKQEMSDPQVAPSFKVVRLAVGSLGISLDGLFVEKAGVYAAPVRYERHCEPKVVPCFHIVGVKPDSLAQGFDCFHRRTRIT